MAPLYPLVAEFGYNINAKQLQQTLEESTLAVSLPFGWATVHYGHRLGLPIVIVEHHSSNDDDLHIVWHDHEAKVTQ
jgi:hypothetical protein